MTTSMHSVRRWIIFYIVGAVGMVVQLVTWFALAGPFGADYRLATALAVEAAVIHNFAWHERWTWRDRPERLPSRRLLRLLRFNLTTGVVSVAGNVGCVWMLVGLFGCDPLPASLLAIAGCSVANFMASDRVVFRISGGFAAEDSGRRGA